jgi:hypothetical protein
MADDDDGGTAMVPKATLDGERAKRQRLQERFNELEGKHSALEGQVKTLQGKADQADTLLEQVGKLQADLEAANAGRAEDAAIFGAGYPDAELVRFEHQRATRDQGDKAPALADWLKALTEENAPTALKGMIPKVDAGDGDGKGDGGGAGGGTGGSGGGGTSGRSTGAKDSGGKTGTKVDNDTARTMRDDDGVLDNWAKLRGVGGD